MQRKFIFYSNIDFQRIYFPITIPSIPLYLNMLLVLASFWKWKFEISRFLRFLQPRNMLDMSVTKQVLKPLTSSFLSSEQPQNIVFIFVTFLVSKLPVSSFSSTTRKHMPHVGNIACVESAHIHFFYFFTVGKHRVHICNFACIKTVNIHFF